MNGARESIHNRCKEHGQANDLAQRPVRKPRPQRSPTRLSRQSRRPLNILRTSTARLLPRQRQTCEIKPDKERQKLVPTLRTSPGRVTESRPVLSGHSAPFANYLRGTCGPTGLIPRALASSPRMKLGSSSTERTSVRDRDFILIQSFRSLFTPRCESSL